MTRPTKILLAALCAISSASLLPAQSGRYRDEVFSQVSVQSDLAYGQAMNTFTQQNETLLLDLYEPTSDSATGRPAIVLVHGGGFVVGTKTDPNYIAIAEAFARRGYVAASIDYRLARPPFGGQFSQAVVDAAHDVKAAVRWFRANANQFGVDPNRIACLGGSSGGIACLEAAYTDSIGAGTSGNPGFSSEVQALITLWGSMQDVTNIEAGEAPMQIIHGTNDPIVPYQGALDLKAQADLVGVTAELLPIPNGSHAEYQAYLQIYQTDSFAFLYEHLRLGELAGLTARPGFASPGTLTLDTFGLAGDLYAIALAPAPASISLPGLGTLCIGPVAEVLIAREGTLAATPRLASASWSVQVPAGLAGVSVYWQGIHVEAATGRWLTNCVETAF